MFRRENERVDLYSGGSKILLHREKKLSWSYSKSADMPPLRSKAAEEEKAHLGPQGKKVQNRSQSG